MDIMESQYRGLKAGFHFMAEGLVEKAARGDVKEAASTAAAIIGLFDNCADDCLTLFRRVTELETELKQYRAALDEGHRRPDK